MGNSQPEEVPLARRLGVFDATMIVMGGIIGAGIFVNPAVVARIVHTPALILGAWLIGGLIALIGAFVYAELAALRPRVGGQYAYLRDAYHPIVAFLYGWTLLLVVQTGGMAGAAIIFGRYFGELFAVSIPEQILAAVALGALGCYVGGLVSDTWGRTTLTIAAMALSGLSAVLIGFTFGGPPWLTLLVGIVWGITVIADSAQFSTAITELSPPAYVGTALTTQTCAGFALTMISIWLVPPVVRLVGWPWAFAMLALGPLFGVISMARLRMLPSGRR